MKLKLISYLVLVLLFISVSPSMGVPDGDQKPIQSSDGTYVITHEDIPFWTGTVTHDMDMPVTNPFHGTYEGVAYDLSGTYNLENYGYDEFYDNAGQNITVNPAEVRYSKWNTSGFIRAHESSAVDGEWAETDSASISTTGIVNVDSEKDGAQAMRISVIESGASSMNVQYTTNFANAISMDKYLHLIVNVESRTLNASDLNLQLIMYENAGQSGNNLVIKFQNGKTDWNVVNSGGTSEITEFDFDTGDVIAFTAKLSDWDSADSTVTLSQIGSMKWYFYSGSAIAGNALIDVIALDFLDSAQYLGDDEGDIVSTSATDHVLFNVTNPSSPDLVINTETLSGNVKGMANAQIDYVAFMQTEDRELFESTNRINYKYQPFLDIDTVEDLTISNAVTWGTPSVKMLMGGDEADYISLLWEGTETKSIFLNEEVGDFVTIASSLSTDTIYALEILIQYTSDEYNYVIRNNSRQAEGLIPKVALWVIGGIVALLSALGMNRFATKVSTYGNRKFSSSTTRKHGFQPRRRS